MRGRQSMEAALAGDYKLDRSSIEWHLNESQEEMEFIKIKLHQAYTKLQLEIKCSSQLEEENQRLQGQINDLHQQFAYQNKENRKLKQTLEIVLKNRKMMQEELDQLQGQASQLSTLRAENSRLKAQNERLTVQNDTLEAEKAALEQQQEEHQQEQTSLIRKIAALEEERNRVAQEKYSQINRLKQELALAQTQQQNPIQVERKRQFSRNKTSMPAKSVYDTRASNSDSFNKENTSYAINQLSLEQQEQPVVAKWNKKVSAHLAQQTSLTPSLSNQDQQLTQFQLTRKKVEAELCHYQKIKRPTPEERERMGRLERELYHLDGDIAGLKRKIRRKY